LSHVETFYIRDDLDASTLRSESQRVLRLIQGLIPSASVMEVGSTAMEGIIGKQDLDFVVRVGVPQFEKTRSILDKYFSRNDQQLSNAEYQGYIVSSSLDVAIQLIVADGKYDTFERFLQLLKRDPSVQQAYNDLKVTWNGRSMQEYRLAKQGFIESVLREDQGQVPEN
jgi:GrpB-like predicted nucleotidyltransferase (UPF0157 family)